MKLIDPTIQIGAFAISQPWWNNVAQQSFYNTTRNNLDFIDYHLYGREFSSPANSILYNDASYLGYGGVDNVRNQATLAGVPITVPIWLSESNIVYSYTNDPAGKMASNVGAVWDALLFESAIKTKTISSIMLFNDRDGVYGKLASNNTKRPAYHNLKILSNNFYGDFVNSTSSDSDVKVLAVKGSNFNSVMICNKSLSDKTVNLNFLNGPINGVLYKKVDLKNSISESVLSWNNNSSYTIPSESIIYLLFNNTLGTSTILKQNELITIENTIINDKKIKLNSSIDNNLSISINDMNGKKIVNLLNQKLNIGTNTIDISDFNITKGIYVLEISNQEGLFKTFKIVFNH